MSENIDNKENINLEQDEDDNFDYNVDHENYLITPFIGGTITPFTKRDENEIDRMIAQNSRNSIDEYIGRFNGNSKYQSLFKRINGKDLHKVIAEEYAENIILSNLLNKKDAQITSQEQRKEANDNFVKIDPDPKHTERKKSFLTNFKKTNRSNKPLPQRVYMSDEQLKKSFEFEDTTIDQTEDFVGFEKVKNNNNSQVKTYKEVPILQKLLKVIRFTMKLIENGISKRNGHFSTALFNELVELTKAIRKTIYTKDKTMSDCAERLRLLYKADEQLDNLKTIYFIFFCDDLFTPRTYNYISLMLDEIGALLGSKIKITKEKKDILVQEYKKSKYN